MGRGIGDRIRTKWWNDKFPTNYNDIQRVKSFRFSSSSFWCCSCFVLILVTAVALCCELLLLRCCAVVDVTLCTFCLARRISNITTIYTCRAANILCVQDENDEQKSCRWKFLPKWWKKNKRENLPQEMSKGRSFSSKFYAIIFNVCYAIWT